ncbi:bifunctional biotin--[acetyl-CoA-carboxylase] ligase/biotin operon repressor BirA [Zhongshania sp. BJYM1]|uniref:bifunctional biotin--[acetyl-CoA-carboxylase] ligase/biotin operon repressor BirA n=1 Tax=Zhongshania aquatica TaxID=2965069 RepID=UPI0022B58A76|nr:bifunctional biotin--[acetyl-CoA-carboxylase] ligase/biotin operon repressor BirA [Marortus sp. BJYM1]
MEILSILADGNYHSGEEIGAHLGVSRAAVWKQLQKLESLQLNIESVKGRGYRLIGGLDLLDSDKIKKFLSSGARDALGQLEILPIIDSTNNAAGAAIKEERWNGYCCLAEQQSAGRGRRGRQWLSPFGRNIYLSQVWGFQSGASALEGLSLSVGLAVVRALTKLGIEGLGLKWPNDVLHNNKKLAGILLEMQGDPAGMCQVIVGVGLNVDMTGAAVADISQPWTDLAQIIGVVDRNKLVAELMSELHSVFREFSLGGFSIHKDEWSRHDAFAGRDVKVQLGDTYIEGTVIGLDHTGGLRLRTAAGERVFNGGEVSLRGL